MESVTIAGQRCLLSTWLVTVSANLDLLANCSKLPELEHLLVSHCLVPSLTQAYRSVTCYSFFFLALFLFQRPVQILRDCYLLPGLVPGFCSHTGLLYRSATCLIGCGTITVLKFIVISELVTLWISQPVLTITAWQSLCFICFLMFFRNFLVLYIPL